MTAIAPTLPLESANARLVGRYEVHQEIGHGSSGTVFLARDPLIGRWIALKTVSAELSGTPANLEQVKRRFLNEAQSAGSLDHPSIVAVHDVVEHDDGQVSVAMEYVAGTDLRRRIDDPEPISFEFIARVIDQVADVLDQTHAQGILHRDIKPANILLGEDGSIKVTDFGIASLVDRVLSNDLAELGTPNYLAPERVLSREVDHRSDIYALGVVLYELLTRRPPFHGEDLKDLARNIVCNEFIPIDTYRPDVPEAFVEVIARSLAKKPDNRYQTAGEMARDFRCAMQDLLRRNDTIPTQGLSPEALPEADTESDFEAAPVEVLPSSPPPPAPLGAVSPQSLALSPIEPSKPIGRVEQSRSGSSRKRPVGAGRSRRWHLIPIVLGFGIGIALFVGLISRLDSTDGLSADTKEGSHPVPVASAARLGRDSSLLPGQTKELQATPSVREEAILEAQVLDALETAREAFRNGRLVEARRSVRAALSLDSSHEESRRLRTAIEQGLSARAAMARDAEIARLAAETEAAALAQPEEPVEDSESTELDKPPVVVSDTAELRIDFYSKRPRGSLTIYIEDRQVFNRKFRYVEKKNFLRRRGIEGGFDTREELPAGNLSLRVYLALPGTPTQMFPLSLNLPGGGLRTLEVRVGAEGKATVRLR